MCEAAASPTRRVQKYPLCAQNMMFDVNVADAKDRAKKVRSLGTEQHPAAHDTDDDEHHVQRGDEAPNTALVKRKE